ncbi:hypothetical protein FQN50_001955 [Emmonsiellopsis sp. PD_5]|nr:hypothetical protein FQN50_001955 [Emmonsiellopsis sp. PD_5]
MAEPQSQPVEMVAATEEEWARWTPYSIIRALTQAEEYEKWRNDKIAWAKEKGGDDPEQNSMLQHLLENTPPKPPIPPSEPPGLDPIVYDRLMGLEYMIKNKVFSEDYLVNTRAAMAGYRSGTLKLTPGLRTYWYGGKIVVGPTTEVLDIAEKLPEWREKYGEGAPWIEELSVTVTVSALGTAHNMIVLDDTGSAYLELFYDDCLALGFNLDLIPQEIYRGDIRLMTGNEPI